MKKLLLVLLAAAVMLTPAVAQADNLVVGDMVKVTDVTTGPYAGNGSVTLGSGGTWWANNNFMTFCIELGEHISLGSTYVVSGIEDYAVGGSYDAVNGKDDLSDKTRALYAYFRSGASFTGEDLQLAFWYFEEKSYFASPVVNAATIWADANAATYCAANPEACAGVKALNLQIVGGDQAQSLLTTTVPDGGMTLMLLGGALMGLGALRRKLQ